MIDIQNLIRDNIRNLVPYSSARSEFKGSKGIFLDANENPFNTPYNRYPDPLQCKVKEKLAELKGVLPEQIFLGNGSDEAIDLLFRSFCEPYTDNVISIHPSYGMYQVAADINAVKFEKVPLLADYSLDIKGIKNRINGNTKMIFICSPNNPTGNSFVQADMLKLLDGFNGILVIDEAYIDFSMQKSLIRFLNNYSNLVILQTFSKAWGLAGLRMGIAFASKEVVQVLNKVKYPYNVNLLTQKLVLEALMSNEVKNGWVEEIIKQRNLLIEELSNLPIVEKIYPTDANFVLVKVKDAKKLYDYLVNNNIITRDRSKVQLCEQCLRITIGNFSENQALIGALKSSIKQF